MKKAGDIVGKRDQLVDALKGLGMILVVGGHSGTPFSRYYYTFHMGLFFFLSGYLSTDTNNMIAFRSFMYKKVTKIFIPYTCFFAISILFAELWSYKNSGVFFSIGTGHIKAFLCGGGYLANFTMNFSLWFFHSLFLADLCMFFILRLQENIKVLVFVFLIILTIPFQMMLPGRPVFHINVLPAALVYMLFGYWVNKLGKVQEIKFHISYGIEMLFAGWYLSNKFGGNISQINSLFYYFESFCTIWGLWIILSNIKRIRCLEYIGERSVFVLGLHSLFLYITVGLANYIMKGVGIQNDFLFHLLVVIITLILCCSAADIYQDIIKIIKNQRFKTKIITL